MTTRRELLAVGAGVATSALVGRNAHADDVDATLAKLTKARAGLQTLQATFAQTRIIGLLATKVKSTGSLAMVHPNRLRWELHPPDAVTYWIGPEGLAMKNSEGVSRIAASAAGRFAAVLGDLMLLLGGDLAKLRKRYALRVETSGSSTIVTAVPTGKDVKKHIKRLRLRVGKILWRVEQIEIHERAGGKSIIALSGFKKNVPIPANRMRPPV